MKECERDEILGIRLCGKFNKDALSAAAEVIEATKGDKVVLTLTIKMILFVYRFKNIEVNIEMNMNISGKYFEIN